MNAPLEGIREKLERAYENIGNLDVEIASFFEKCEYPVIPKMNDEKYFEALQYHASLRIPIRFSVLAGEIVHHLRSCLDHLVWQLSTVDYREGKNSRFIEFPILKERPAPKDKFTKYKRKIKGITSCRALKMIANIQPYRSTRPELDAVWSLSEYL